MNPMKSTFFSSISVILFILLFLVNETAQGQGLHLASRNTALGGGGTAYMTGYHANFINPANLMLSSQDTLFTFGFLGGLGTSAGGRLMNISLYNDNFTKGYVIDSEMAKSISDDWFGTKQNSMRHLGFALDVVPLGISYQRGDMTFSSAFRVRTLGTLGASKGLFDLALLGPNNETFGNRRAVNIYGELLAMTEWSFGYAMEVWRNQEAFAPGTMRVTAGAAPKILFGYGYAKAGMNSHLQVTGQGMNTEISHDFDHYIFAVGNLSGDIQKYYDEENNEDIDLFEFVDDDSFSDLGSALGHGLGLDFGGTFEWYLQDVSYPVIGSGPQILRLSLAFTDIGSIRFKENAGTFRAKGSFLWDGLEIDFDEIDQNHEGDFFNYLDYVLEDSIITDIYGTKSIETSFHRVGLTPMINIGAALSMGKFNAMVDIGKGLNNRGINSSRMFTSIGAEYHIVNVIPVRLGLRMGGHSSANLSFGTGVNVKNFEFSAGFMATPSSKRSGANIAAAWSGFYFRF